MLSFLYERGLLSKENKVYLFIVKLKYPYLT